MKTVFISRFCITLFLFLQFSPGAIAQTVSGVINSYHKVTAINTVTNTLTLDNAAGLSIGARVLLIQMKGAGINSTNSNSFGDLTALNNAGIYEFNAVCAISGNDVLLRDQVTRTYTPSGSVQLVAVPRYNMVTVTDTVKAAPWNVTTGTGGIVALEADTIFLNSAIDASGSGFAGGALFNFDNATYSCNNFFLTNQFPLPVSPSPSWYSGAPKGEGIADFIAGAEYAKGKQANGGGGGNNHNAGGAGGGNYGAGGGGGMRSDVSGSECTGAHPGVGGLSLSSQGYTPASNRIFLGGGGGAGHQNNNVGTSGGNGGGIAIVRANVIVSAGASILADGGRPYNPTHVTDPFASGGDGGGGGGAGGTIILDVNSVSGSIIAEARGARGSDAQRTGGGADCGGPGGGGGGGVVWMRGAAPIANVTTVVTAGANGVGSPVSPNPACRNQAAGAASGAAGASLTGYIAAVSNPLVCIPLPIRELKSFTGRATADGVLLQWWLHSTDNIALFEVERTVDKVRYTTIASLLSNGSKYYTTLDRRKPAGTCWYRLKIYRPGNAVEYSELIKIADNPAAAFEWLTLKPNPAGEQATIGLFSKKSIPAKVIIYSAAGQQVANTHCSLSAGYNNLQLPLKNLAPGMYWISIEVNGIRSVKKLMKAGTN